MTLQDRVTSLWEVASKNYKKRSACEVIVITDRAGRTDPQENICCRGMCQASISPCFPPHIYIHLSYFTTNHNIRSSKHESTWVKNAFTKFLLLLCELKETCNNNYKQIAPIHPRPTAVSVINMRRYRNRNVKLHCTSRRSSIRFFFSYN